MAVTTTVYRAALAKMMNKEIDWDTDTVKVALTTSTYTPASTTHDYFNDITNEVVGTGYTAGGATLASKTVTQVGSTYQFDAADTAWAASTITARYAVVYVDTAGASSTDPLICYVDFGTDQSSSAGTFTITWDATGVIVGTAT